MFCSDLSKGGAEDRKTVSSNNSSATPCVVLLWCIFKEQHLWCEVGRFIHEFSFCSHVALSLPCSLEEIKVSDIIWKWLSYYFKMLLLEGLSGFNVCFNLQLIFFIVLNGRLRSLNIVHFEYQSIIWGTPMCNITVYLIFWKKTHLGKLTFLWTKNINKYKIFI